MKNQSEVFNGKPMKLRRMALAVSLRMRSITQCTDRAHHGIATDRILQSVLQWCEQEQTAGIWRDRAPGASRHASIASACNRVHGLSVPPAGDASQLHPETMK